MDNDDLSVTLVDPTSQWCIDASSCSSSLLSMMLFSLTSSCSFSLLCPWYDDDVKEQCLVRVLLLVVVVSCVWLEDIFNNIWLASFVNPLPILYGKNKKKENSIYICEWTATIKRLSMTREKKKKEKRGINNFFYPTTFSFLSNGIIIESNVYSYKRRRDK